tara:strand:- start:6661 stop:8322 length:1662 start_codon:yes stop_codon:yes gene_type:complete
MLRSWQLLLLLLCMSACVPSAQARDRRLALVVAHQHGWQGEQMLPWVVSGDVKPLSQLLRKKLGFQVVRVVNRDAQTLRKVFRKLLRQMKRQPVDTFLFYYSGHADKRHFHLGERGQRPLGYKEFLQFFLKLPVKRRFAILDACHGGAVIPLAQRGALRFRKGHQGTPRRSEVLQIINQQLPQKKRFRTLSSLRAWYRLSIAKGVKRPKKRIDFRRLSALRREDGAGTHIIGTIGTAWHEPKLGASLLTYHLLRGLKGQADTVQDGRITIEELYNFLQAETRKKGQRISRFVLFNGNYTFAPHYQSRLQIGANVVGRVQLSVEQFVWSFQKKKSNRIEIPALSGKGVVEIHHKGRCWRQAITLRKGDRVHLYGYGKPVHCQRRLATRKGSIALNVEATVLPTLRPDWIVAAYVGANELGVRPLRSRNLSLGLGLQTPWLGGGLMYDGGVASQGWWLHRLSLQVEKGLPFHWRRWTLQPAVYVKGGIVSSQINAETTNVALSGGVGGLVDVDWFFSRRWGVRLRMQLGVQLEPVAERQPFSLHWGLQIASLFAP